MIAFVRWYQEIAGILVDHGRCREEGTTCGLRNVTTPLRCRPLVDPERPDRCSSGAWIQAQSQAR